jgi:hypothetical protein
MRYKTVNPKISARPVFGQRQHHLSPYWEATSRLITGHWTAKIDPN